MNDKFIEAFTDIDDELIKSAKPIAQEPIELKTEPRRFSWKKLTAAAACVAVLGAGGAAAVKVMRSQNGPDISDPTSSGSVSMSAADSRNSSSITDNMTVSQPLDNSTDSSSPNTGSAGCIAEFKEKLKETGDKFEYNGKIYGVIGGGGGGGGSDNTINTGNKFTVGVRREIINGIETVEFAAFVENIGIEPVGLMSTASSPDKPILLRFDLNDESIDAKNIFDRNEFKYMAYVLQPGEIYFQTVSFPVTEAEYLFSTCVSTTDPKRFDESKPYDYNKQGYYEVSRRANYSDKSVGFDDIWFFGSSASEKESAAAANSEQ
ncbi:MAG: hypothetical protein J1F03_02825 [Oscillospiraceae bacterium]|nr:hypothetical protein [Oscillospiraceae bacterium]